MSDVAIYHNPDCATSRSTLALIRACGIEPRVIEYLKTPPSEAELVALLDLMGMSVRELLRRKDTPFVALGLEDLNKTDDALHAAAQKFPILINRPIVVTNDAARLCRPSDIVLDLFPQRPDHSVARDDGTPFLVDRQCEGTCRDLTAAMEAAGLPTADLADPGRVFFHCTTLDREGVGWGGYELYGSDVLLRSMAVMPRFHGKGNGRNLAALLMRRAHDEGARRAYVLTDKADSRSFFEKLGFASIERSAAPASILATRQATDLCAGSATLLTKRITL